MKLVSFGACGCGVKLLVIGHVVDGQVEPEGEGGK